MLLIAQPKSSSTSVACTIGMVCHLNVKLGIPSGKRDKKCKGFNSIQNLHNNMSERSDAFLSQTLKGRKTLFKEHLLPTDDHINKLRKVKERYVILLRDPMQSYNAYLRCNIKQKDGVLEDLINFHNRWMWFKSNKPNVMIIYYEDLILNYTATMKKILNHYKLNGQIIPLLKKKYTGIGVKELKKTCY